MLSDGSAAVEHMKADFVLRLAVPATGSDAFARFSSEGHLTFASASPARRAAEERSELQSGRMGGTASLTRICASAMTDFVNT